jgi:hypothetical protein
MNTQTFRTSRYLLPVIVTGVFALVSPAFGQVINEDVKLLANDGDVEDSFGYSISIDNGVVAVGTIFDQDNGFRTGSAYLFNASTGAQIVKLLPTSGATGIFGRSIAIDNGLVAVGSRNSAHIFNAATGIQTAALLADDRASNDDFGYSIAIDNGLVAVGAWGDDDNGSMSGSVYLFNALTGVQLLKLLPSDGAAFDHFGYSVAISNGIVAVGANEERPNGLIRSGSAYLFDAASGAQLAKLVPSVEAANARFGRSIAIDNGVVAVGTRLGSAVYLFDTSTGTEFAILSASDGATSDYFGTVAIDNGVVAVGAQYDRDNGNQSGSAYVFDAATGVEIAKLLPSDGAVLDQFGYSIAISNGVVAVGANLNGENGFESGSAYVFSVPGADCLADLTGEGTLDFFDISAFLSAFNNSDPIADFTGDGIYDFFDVSAFLQLFAAGCP